MRAPLSWIREYADLPADVTAEHLARRLTALGLKLESLERPGQDLRGLVVGRVLSVQPERQRNGKTISWCAVDVGDAGGTGEPQGIVCGAQNFGPGDLVVVVLPGGVLPAPGGGGVEITARKSYGHLSAGMICSARELGLGDDHTGILVLPDGAGSPGDDAAEVLHLRDEVLEFEINPDRGYALSVRGVAREAALGYDAAFTDPAGRPLPTADRPAHPVVVEDPDGCPVFSGRAVTGFDPTAPTPLWMARRIQLAGMRPISLAVDVTNYVMLELGQPLHGFDRGLLQGPIRVRRARPGERLRTLDGVDRALSPEDLLLADDSGPIGLAGVMGGATTELSEATTEIFLEAAHWDPVSIFRTERRHRLPSEAARRFERGTDPTITLVAADRAAELLTTYGGGSVDPGVTSVGAPPARPTIRLASELPARLTGLSVDGATTVDSLLAVGCEVGAEAAGRLPVTPPPWRSDLTDPYDLVEEVARLVGYDRIPSVLPQAPAGRGLTRGQRLRRRVGRTLAGAGYVEIVSFPFVGAGHLDRLGLPVDDDRRQLLRLANPLSTEEPAMTTTLLPRLLETVARNAGRGAPGASLFEIATVTLPFLGAAGPAPVFGVDGRPDEGELADLDKALPQQPLHLAVALAGEREPAGWWGPGRPADWADAVDAVRRAAEAVGVEVSVTAAARAPWHPGRCAELRVGGAGGTVVGHAGELHPQACRAYRVPPRTSVAEIDLDALLEQAPPLLTTPEVSSFPVAKEDVAVVVDASVPAADVEAALREGAGDLLESVHLFDVYTGEQVGPGRKSLAFALRLRAPDRTLTEQEVSAARDAAVALAAARCGAVLRA